MNWGAKIVIGLGSFMLFIVCVTIYMVNKDSDTLLEDDYYEKGLTYDDVFDRKQNLQDDNAQPILKLENDTLSIIFKSDNIKGDLNFIRPSDGNLDKVIPLFTTTNTFKLPLATLAKGSWSLEINWESHNKKYIDTQTLFIN